MLKTSVLALDDIISGFTYAARNQQTFDRLYYHALGLKAEDFNVLPRPAKWANKYYFSTKLIKLTSSIIAYSWGYFFAYLYISARVLTHAARKKLNGCSSGREGGVVFFAVCDRSCMVLSKIKVGAGPQVWLKPPGLKFSTNPEKNFGITIIDAACLLSFRDILTAGRWALASHRSIKNNYGITLGLQSYAVVEWMLMFLATTNLAPRYIVTSEHHDRWAVMADFYCSVSTKAGNECRLELAQHGMEYENTYQIIEKVAEEGGIPYRLEYVYKIHVYDNEQLRLFENHIFKRGLAEKKDFITEFLDKRITLTNCGGEGLKVLFVGHPFCEELQVMLYNRLFKGSPIWCFYKPHPTASPTKKVAEIGWDFISDMSCFPSVDFLVSYPSTLVKEYAAMGIPSVLHQNSVVDEGFDGVVADIKKHLEILGGR